MRDRIVVERTLKADDDGNVLVRCPECDVEFKMLLSNLADENMALSESITCPSCNHTLNQVYPSREITDLAKAEMGRELTKDIKNDLKKAFK